MLGLNGEWRHVWKVGAGGLRGNQGHRSPVHP